MRLAKVKNPLLRGRIRECLIRSIGDYPMMSNPQCSFGGASFPRCPTHCPLSGVILCGGNG
jgi:hypothetical protein